MSKDPLKQFHNKKILVSFWIGGITVGMIGVFGLIGYLIDSRFDSNPFGMIIMILVSFPISQIVIYKKVKKDLL